MRWCQWCWWSSGARDRSDDDDDDDDAGKQCHTSSPSPSFIILPSSLFHLPLPVWSRAAKVSAIGGLSPTLFLFPDTGRPACVPLSRHRQSSDLLTCTCATHPTKHAPIHLYLFPSLFPHTCLFRRFSSSMLFTSWSSESAHSRGLPLYLLNRVYL